ncbi:MAG: FHA domain-containing protein [Sulfurovum sp.]|nr:FHA domain-containing protein [Sulfurovum sp.]
MLLDKQLKSSNFVDGIKFNPDQIQISQNYFNQKMALTNLYGIGKGILIGFMDSLELIIENNTLVLKSGAAIDHEGNIILVPQSHLVSNDILTSKYKNRTMSYVYIVHENKMDDLDVSRHDKNIKLYYSISETYQVIVSDKKMQDRNLLELARVYIKQQDSEVIKNPINPFVAKENEIDKRYSSKIIGENTSILLEDRDIVAQAIKTYAQFVHEFGLRHSIQSMSTVASFAYKISSDIKNTNTISVWAIYDMLFDLLVISLKVELERDDIINTAFWKNIIRLKSIFSFGENLKVSYYQLLLNINSSFFSKVLLHFNNASIFDGNWEDIFKEKKIENITKDYIIVGSSPSCDMVVEGEDVAMQHAKIYIYETGYFIQDLEETSGIYVNSQRVEKGTKKFIRKQDYVVLGKNGRVLNLQNISI